MKENVKKNARSTMAKILFTLRHVMKMYDIRCPGKNRTAETCTERLPNFQTNCFSMKTELYETWPVFDHSLRYGKL